MKADFLIVGGGIGGTVLGALLARGGRRVTVLERSTAPPSWTRPELLWPATARVLFSLLPAGEWQQDAILRLEGLELFDDGRFTPVVTRTLLEEAGVRPWSTDPNHTRERLLHLDAFEVYRGVEVTEVLKEQDRVVGVRTRACADGAEHEWLADYTVGDDGGHSSVRKACGIDLRTRAFPVEFFCFKSDWPAKFPPAVGRVWPNRQWRRSGILALGGLPVPNGHGAGLVPVLAKLFNTSEHLDDAWAQFCAIDPRMGEVMGRRRFPDDFMRVRREWGHAERYGAPGALLLGDAAHPVSPAGGQGANMSVADARVLAELILNHSRNVLAEYERCRRPANNRSLRFTRVASFVTSLPEPLLSVVSPFAVLDHVRRRPLLVRQFVRMASTAFLERPDPGDSTQ